MFHTRDKRQRTAKLSPFNYSPWSAHFVTIQKRHLATRSTMTASQTLSTTQGEKQKAKETIQAEDAQASEG